MDIRTYHEMKVRNDIKLNLLIALPVITNIAYDMTMSSVGYKSAFEPTIDTHTSPSLAISRVSFIKNNVILCYFVGTMSAWKSGVEYNGPLDDDLIKWKHFRVTGPLCGEITGHRWTPLTKASDVELWCFLWSAP